MTELVKVQDVKEPTKADIEEAKKYGLEVQNVLGIKEAFQVVSVDLSAIIPIYDEIIKSDITDELCERAGKLSTKMSKVNALLNKTHKAKKALALAEGRYCDQLKNVAAIKIQAMQSKLKELKDYRANQLKKEQEKLQIDRSAELEKYEVDPIPGNLGEMLDNVWDAYLTGCIKNYEDAKELGRISKLDTARREILAPYSEFMQDVFIDNYGSMSDDNFNKLLNSVRFKREDHDKKLREEEERKEAERLEKEKIAKTKRFREASLKPYSQFIPEEHPDFGELDISEWEDFFQEMKNAKEDFDKKQEALRIENDRLKREDEQKEKAHQEKLRLEREEQAKKQAIIDEQLAREKAENDRLKKAEQDRQLAEQRAIEEAEQARQAELNKSDATKIKDYVNDLEALKTKYTFKSKKNQAKCEYISNLLDTAINHIGG